MDITIKIDDTLAQSEKHYKYAKKAIQRLFIFDYFRRF
jgi:hypothetical protein